MPPAAKEAEGGARGPARRCGCLRRRRRRRYRRRIAAAALAGRGHVDALNGRLGHPNPARLWLRQVPVATLGVPRLHRRRSELRARGGATSAARRGRPAPLQDAQARVRAHAGAWGGGAAGLAEGAHLASAGAGGRRAERPDGARRGGRDHAAQRREPHARTRGVLLPPERATTLAACDSHLSRPCSTWRDVAIPPQPPPAPQARPCSTGRSSTWRAPPSTP